MKMQSTTLLLALLVGLSTLVSSATAAPRRVKRILHFSDVHLNLSTSLDPDESDAIPFAYGADAPIGLLKSALEYAQEVIPDPTFLLYTGDHVAHGDFTDQYVAHAVEQNVDTIEKYYPPASDMLETTAIIGNADGNPDYHMEVTNPKNETNPSIELISGVWNHSLSPTNLASFNRRGYLKFALDERLVVLTLNTVPYSPSHVPDTSSQKDPFGQFAWLNATLQELREASQYAYIAGHVAPLVDSYGGNPQWHVHYLATYQTIVASYADVIKAQFFGHVHSIEFRIPVATPEADMTHAAGDVAARVPVYVAGSISPLFGNNPSFMIWEFDADTYEVVDYTVYGTNISDSDQKLQWRPLIQASEAYALTDLSTASLQTLYERMETDPALLEEYYWNMKARSFRLPPCDTSVCRAHTLCTLKWWATKGEFLACVDSSTSTYNLLTLAQASPATGEATDDRLDSSQVYMVIGVTVVATAIVVALVLIAMTFLRRNGIIKSMPEAMTPLRGMSPPRATGP